MAIRGPEELVWPTKIGDTNLVTRHLKQCSIVVLYTIFIKSFSHAVKEEPRPHTVFYIVSIERLKDFFIIIIFLAWFISGKTELDNLGQLQP